MRLTFTLNTSLDPRKRRARNAASVAFFFAIVCLVSIVGALIVSVGVSPAFETMRVARSSGATRALHHELSTLYWLSIVSAQIGLLFGVRSHKTWAGAFAIYATGIPLTAIVLLKITLLVGNFLLGH